MTHPAVASFREFADLIGCRPSYVTELRKAGRLVLTDDGKAVRVAESIARIEASRDPAMKAVADRHAAARGAELATSGGEKVPEAGAHDPDAEEAEGGPDFQLWKARKERAAALREEIKLGEEAKEYLRRDDALAVVSNAFVTLRTELEALPDSIAPVLAGESDEQRVRVLLAEEIEHALGNLAEQIGKLGTRGA